MKKIKNIIIILVGILVVLAIIIVQIKKEFNNEEEEFIKIDETEELQEETNKLHIEKDLNRVYIVKNCVEQLFQNYSNMNFKNLDIKLIDQEVDKEKRTQKYAEKVYAMLDKQYIEYRNITKENIKEKLGLIEKVEIKFNHIFSIYLEDNSYICFVDGLVKERNLEARKFKIAVRLNNTGNFKIFLEDYLVENDYSNFQNIKDISKLCEEEITNDIYNVYKNRVISSKEYVNDLFKHYKDYVINDIDYSYQLIKDEYKNIRFENQKEYEEYVEKNYSNIVSRFLETYSIKEKNEITQYICKDNYGNYYIFEETAPFQYTVMLDNYTIPTEDFIETYNSSSDIEKVILNIKKFFMGIDDKNYRYAYNVLSEGFKNNKYPNKEEFIKYVEANFFEKNEIEYDTYKKENGVYIYKIKISDSTGKNKEIREINIIMKLNSGTDFEMSFGEN